MIAPERIRARSACCLPWTFSLAENPRRIEEAIRRGYRFQPSTVNFSLLVVSVIIPTYNEAESIGRTLKHLGCARGDFEVIVVDGESTDETPRRVESLATRFPRPLRLIRAKRNRGVQLNLGTGAARGDKLLFLHADALLPCDAIEALESALGIDSFLGGNFTISFAGGSAWSRFFTWANRVRHSFGIYYGDSGLFVRKDVFERLGGFRPIPIMEDYEFVRRLERAGRTVCLPTVVMVSDRRWRVQGILKTLLSWVCVQSLYSLGVSPIYLARWYKPVRDGSRDQLRI